MIDLDGGDSLDLLPEWMKQRGPVSGNGPSSPAAQGVQPAQPDDSAYEDRLSVGQRIGGAIKQPSYMRSRAGAPDAEPAPDARPQFDPNLLPAAIRPRSMPAPDQIARPPVGVNSQRRLDLMAEESRLNKPIDPGTVDPKTGKPIYRYGTGAKIVGTIANALGAFGSAQTGRPFAPVDYFGTNARYDREENLRKGRLAGVESDLSEQEKLEGSQERAYSDAVRAAYDSSLAESKQRTSEAQTETADVRKQLADLKANNPGAAALRERDADKYGLTGEARTDFILTGKLPREMMGPERQPTELEVWMQAFRRDNGRAPTADEIANRKSRQSSKADQIEKDKDTGLAKAEADAKGQLGKLDISAYTKDASKLPGETPSQWRQRRQQEIYADLEKKKAQVQKDYETRAAGNATAGRAPVSSPRGTAAPPPRPTQAPPAGRVWVYDKKTGNRGTIPASQLKSATSGQDAKYGVW